MYGACNVVAKPLAEPIADNTPSLNEPVTAPQNSPISNSPTAAPVKKTSHGIINYTLNVITVTVLTIFALVV